MSISHTDRIVSVRWWWIRTTSESGRPRHDIVAEDRDGQRWVSAELLRRLDEAFDHRRYRTERGVALGDDVAYGPTFRPGQRSTVVRVSAAREVGNDDVLTLLDCIEPPHSMPHKSAITRSEAVVLSDVVVPARPGPRRQWLKAAAFAHIMWRLMRGRALTEAQVCEDYQIAARTWRHWRYDLLQIPGVKVVWHPDGSISLGETPRRGLSCDSTTAPKKSGSACVANSSGGVER